MHLKSIELHPERFPENDRYPFCLSIFRQMRRVSFETPITLFVGENGTGKSTLLKAICRRCGVHIWQDTERVRFENNPFEDKLGDYIDLEWERARVPGSYFGSDIFRFFTEALDEWAASDPGQLAYFGGSSLVTKSHGQSLMAYFRARYKIEGLYFLDEPETALSPRSQLELLDLLAEMAGLGHAQFIVASHSPILLACPEAMLYSFDRTPLEQVRYEDTDHYRIYRAFMEDRSATLAARS